MTFADVAKLREAGEQMDALKADGKLTQDEWQRLYDGVKDYATDGQFLLALIKRSPSGYKITVSE